MQRPKLRLRMDFALAVAGIAALCACAPRSTPAPVFIGNMYAPPPGASVVQPAGAGSQGRVVVQPGDTLIAISRYHQTALLALIEANNLEPPYVIKPGQVLRLPEQGTQPPRTPAPAAYAQPHYTGAAPGQGPQERMAVTQQKLPPSAGPNTEVRSAPSAIAAAARPGAAATAEAAGKAEKKPSSAASGGNSAIASGDAPGRDSGDSRAGGFEVADEAVPVLPPSPPAKQRISPPAAPAQAAGPGTVRFLWPARGPILSDFGSKQNGLHNDGINIAMPPNGPVLAAGSGVVSYAGNGLRGYGNLLLIRHEGGWVTAYAHNSELLVRKGDQVARGQVIAKAGRSGGVNQDQLHFEIRQGVKALNPTPLLVEG